MFMTMIATGHGAVSKRWILKMMQVLTGILVFFHGRVEAWKNDPLIVISFRNEIIPAPDGFDKGFELAVIHAISDHDTLFGEGWEKTFPDHMRTKRKQNATILSFHADINQPDAEGTDEP